MDEIQRIIEGGRETRGIEFKAAMSFSDDHTRAKVVKAALAMSNKRDGGVLVFGMNPSAEPGAFVVAGVSPEQADSFDPDKVIACVNAHAAPSVELTVVRQVIEAQTVVVVSIREFRDYPTICSKAFVVNGKPLLIRGRIYCRSRRMPESTEVQSEEDLREIIDLAIEKGAVRYARLRDLELTASGKQPTPPELDQSTIKFRRQAGDL